MSEVTRRSFLTKGSVGAMGAIGALSVGPAALATAIGGSAEAELTAEELDALGGPLFVHVLDASTGEIEVMVDDTSVVFQDKALVAKVLRTGK